MQLCDGMEGFDVKGVVGEVEGGRRDMVCCECLLARW